MKLWLDEGFKRRLWAKIAVRGPNDCWLWKAKSKTSREVNKGYGTISLPVTRKKITAHRAVWIVTNRRAVRRSRDVMHSCDVRLCCNPRHLSQGSRKKNARDCAAKGRNPGNRVTNFKGELHPRSKITEAGVRQILRLRRRGFKQKDIAARLSLHQTTISNVLTGRTWSHLSPIAQRKASR